VNFDYPNSGEDYIHRIGRTARANKTGTAYTFFTDANGKNASELVQVMEEAGQTVPPKLASLAGRHYNGRKRMRYSSESDDRKGGYSSGSKRPGSSSYGNSSYGGSSAKRALPAPAPSGPPRSSRGGYSAGSSRGNSSSGGYDYNNQNGYSGGASSQTGSSSNWNQGSSSAPSSQPVQPTYNPSQQNGFSQGGGGGGASSGSAQQWADYQKQMEQWQQKNQQWQQWQQTQGSSGGQNPY